MLLTAMLDGNRVDAATFTSEAWVELQRSEDRKRMVMPVCNVRAVAKTRGPFTRYFAHHRRDGCKVDHGGESPQHLAMKEALRLCIDRVPDWHAIVEHPHPSREWIIDVLAESDDFTKRVAFEVQLSSQTPENYFARSQRYFDSGAFPVWLIPRQLEYHETKVPVVVTGFGKTSEVPDDPAELLALPADQNFLLNGDSVGAFVEALLRKGHSWIHGTPHAQAEAQRAAEEAAAVAAEAERMKQETIKQQIEAMNDLSASPESAFGHHTVRTHLDIHVWGSLTCCWECEEPMLVWDARTWALGGGMPRLQVKSEVDQKRLENHPEVHRAVDGWIRAAKPDVSKAVIKKRHTLASGRLYSAFVCPSCDSTMGQFFIACIRPEKWSVLGSPAAVPPPVPVIKIPAATTSPTPLRCRIHETPKEECDWCQKRPSPRLGRRY